jgi:hypothetical protein
VEENGGDDPAVWADHTTEYFLDSILSDLREPILEKARQQLRAMPPEAQRTAFGPLVQRTASPSRSWPPR